MRQHVIRTTGLATAATVASFLLAPALVANAELGAAPNFTLESRDGGTASLAEHLGDVVMINFWATWCGPCRQEMPHLEALHQRYGSLGFTLLGVNVEENSQDALDWLEEMPVSFPILFDPDNAVSELYDVIAMPSTVIVDRQGMVRHVHHGYQSGYENEYQSQIRALIRE